MENREQFKQPEIFEQEAMKVLETLKFEDFEGFEYNGTNFLIILQSQEDIDESENKEEVFFTRSTEIDGYDIYVLDSLPIQEKRRRVFHEIIEANLRVQDFDDLTADDIAKRTEQEVFGERESNQKEIRGVE